MTFCTECGSEIVDQEATFCSRCGGPVKQLRPTQSIETEEVSRNEEGLQEVDRAFGLPMAFPVLVALGLFSEAVGSASFTNLYFHPVLFRLVYVISGVGFALFGAAVLTTFKWAKSRKVEKSSILVGVGLIVASTWYFVIGVVSHTATTLILPSPLTQNVATVIAIIGWVVASVGIFVAMPRLRSR